MSVTAPLQSSIPKSGDAARPSPLAVLIVEFYRWWHGRLHLKGAGYVLRKSSTFVAGLQHYPLEVKGVGSVHVDFRDYSGVLWLQHLLGEKLAAFDIEKGLFQAIARALKDEQVFWDVGANLGTISAFIVTSMPRVKVFAFEPNPDIFKSLDTLFIDSAGVRVFPFALSDTDGQVALTIPKGKSVGASIEGIDYVLKTGSLTANDVVQVQVQAFSGDSLLESNRDLLPPHVVKIDVEGHEPAVLNGFARTVAKYRPVIFFEHLYLSDNEVAKLVPQGYVIRSVDDTTGEFSPGFDRSVGHNSVLIPNG